MVQLHSQTDITSLELCRNMSDIVFAYPATCNVFFENKSPSPTAFVKNKSTFETVNYADPAVH